jgi:hypothetical protein
MAHRVPNLARMSMAPFRQVRWKIMAPYAVLTLVCAVMATFMVTRLVTGSLEERFTNQLVEANRVASDSFVRRERQHLETLRAFAYTEGAVLAIDARDAAKLRELALPIAANDRTDRVEVLDSTGRRQLGLQVRRCTGGPVRGPRGFGYPCRVGNRAQGARGRP